MKLHRGLVTVALLGLVACRPAADEGEGEAPSAPPVEAAAPAAAGESGLLTTSESLAARLEDPGVVVLHVGADRAEYDRGHLPGARFLPMSAITRETAGNPNELPPVAQLDSVFEALGVSDDSRVVIYGAPLPAARAFFTLDYLGHGERASLLDGGIAAWTEAGQQLSTDTAASARGSFTPRPRPERAVDAAWVNEHRTDDAIALVDARPLAQFTGEEPGEGVQRPGHIPGAANLFWEETIESTDRPALRDVEALRAMFEEAGASPGDTVVTYCRTGMQASFAYFVARYLGYETKMYDPSFIDWSRRTELPVEAGAAAPQ